MLVKCESKSVRIKAVAFHPKLPWALVGLQTGSIQLWDYKRSCLLYKFDGHIGPVRALHFHPSQSIFCSGGDDHDIIVWDYDRRCQLFKLCGHLDYVRTVEFHNEYPWILSASDDQTIRIWNWQSRQCISVLAGHHHFVMCARFHPNLDIIGSCSMDQTIRIWDITGLKEKTVARLYNLNEGSNCASGGSYFHDSLGAAGSSISGNNLDAMAGPTGLGQEVICKYIIESHDRSVNWLDFHPTMNMIVSGSDDRTIKLYRFDDSRWWEIDCLKGHYHNISVVRFLPHSDLIISNSEDHTIRLWDLNTRKLIHTVRRDNDRFWSMDCLDSTIIVGHDSGMIVFKLNRERPAAAVLQSEPLLKVIKCATEGTLELLSLKPRNVSSPNFASVASSAVSVTVVTTGNGANSNANLRPYQLVRNHMSNTDIILAVLYSGGYGTTSNVFTYDIFTSQGKSGEAFQRVVTNASCLSLQFCGRSKYVVLTPSRKLELHSLLLKEDAPKILEVDETIERIFSGGSNNRVLLRASNGSLLLFDTINKKVHSTLDLSIAGGSGNKGKVRYAVWNEEKVVLLSKNYICVVKCSNGVLQHIFSLHEPSRVKSAIWVSPSVILYTTTSHLKYIAIPTDTTAHQCSQGIVSSLQQNATGNTYLQNAKPVSSPSKTTHRASFMYDVWYINSTGDLKVMANMNVCEPFLKLAIQNQDLELVTEILSFSTPPGRSWIQFLRDNDFPHIAYNYVNDIFTKFELALKCGDLDCAHQHLIQYEENHQRQSEPENWMLLGSEALKAGRVDLASLAFQKSRNYNKLISLFSLTGDTQKLKKLTSIVKLVGRENLTVQANLFAGDVEARVEVLKGKNQLALAYMAAKSHGLEEVAAAVGVSGEVAAKLDAAICAVENKKLLAPAPATSIPLAVSVWPTKASANRLAQLPKVAPAFVAEKERSTAAGQMSSVEQAQPEVAGAWIDNDDDDWLKDEEASSDNFRANDDTCDNTVEQALVGDGVHSSSKELKPGARLPLFGSMSVGQLIAYGKFAEAKRVLEEKLGIENIGPLKPLMKAQYIAAQSLMPSLPLLGHIPMLKTGEKGGVHELYDVTSFNAKFRQGLSAFGARQLDSCLDCMHECLLQSCLLSLSSLDEEVAKTIRTNTSIAAEYILAVSLLRDASTTSDPAEKLQLHCTATKAKITPSHQFLLYREACKIAKKCDNNITCAKLIRDMVKSSLESQVPELIGDITKMKTRLLTDVEQKGTNALNGIECDGAICCGSLKLVADENDLVAKCCLCQSRTTENYQNHLCRICQIGKIVK